MPEGQRGRDPNKPSRTEQDKQPHLPEYHRAARFPDERASNSAYEATRQALYETPCELSTYRTVLLPDYLWHVLVLGNTPNETLRDRIDRALLGGEAVELPEEVWSAFHLRRLEQSAKGPWVERRTPRRRTR